VAIRVSVSGPLRVFTGDQKEVVSAGATVHEVLADLITRFPAMRSKLYEDDELAGFINIFVNDEDIRSLAGEDTALSDGDKVSIIYAIAGG